LYYNFSLVDFKKKGFCFISLFLFFHFDFQGVMISRRNADSRFVHFSHVWFFVDFDVSS